MARSPYKTARQEHLGNQLDKLQGHGVLAWQWDYNRDKKRAIFRVQRPGSSWRALDTKRAEGVAQEESDKLGWVWFPVSHPGGERERTETMQRIAQKKRDGRASPELP